MKRKIEKSDGLFIMNNSHQSLLRPSNNMKGGENQITRLRTGSGKGSNHGTQMDNERSPKPPRIIQVQESKHFNCMGRVPRLYADVEAGCKVAILGYF